MGSRPADQSRRTVITAALAGAGAVVANAVAGPLPVRAEGQTVQVGGEYPNATSVTQIQNFTNNATVIAGGSNAAGTGVFGGSASGKGVHGQSPSGSGVHGNSTSGDGVHGVSANGNGVFGFSNGGVGVAGDGTVGVMATGQLALSVVGRASFSRSGIATIPAGQDRVSVIVPGLAAPSFVLATLQQFRTGVSIASASRNVAQQKVTIRLDTTVTRAIRVGWLVLED